MAQYLILYDGVCGICNASVQYVIRHDASGVFAFAPIQGSTAGDILRRHGKDPADLDTVYVVLNQGQPDESLLSEGRAALFVLKQVRGPFLLFTWFSWLPTGVLNWFYQRIARNRYRLAKKLDACPVPSPAVRARFLD